MRLHRTGNHAPRRECRIAGRALAAAVFILLCAAGMRAQSRPPDDFSRLIPPVPGIGSLAPGGTPVDAAIRQKRYGEAERLLYADIQAHPQSAVLLQRIAGVFFLDHRYLNCAIALKKAEALSPLDEHNRFLLAMAYVLMGHEDWARPELQTLQKQNPQQPLYSYWLARLEFSQRRYPQALQHLQQALAVDPGYANGWDLQGLCNYALGRYDAAAQSYRKAVAANRRTVHSPWPPLDFGSLLIKMGRLAEAGPLLREAVQFDPNLEQAHEQLGLLLEKQGNFAQAEAELSRATELAPADPDPHYALARIFRNQGQKIRAARETGIFEKLRREQDQSRAPVSFRNRPGLEQK